MDLREALRPIKRRHPWEIARLQFFAQALAESALQQRRQPLRVLDVGAGDAWLAQNLLKHLPAGSHIDCVDSGYVDVSAMDTCNAQIAYHQDIPKEKWDLIVLLDVLEHVEDDLALLSQTVREALLPNSLVLISVPAWQGLYTSHDKLLHHFRRYSPQQAAQLLQTSGLRILRSGGLFHILLIPRMFSWIGERLLSQSPGPAAITHHHTAAVNVTLQAVLAVDNWASRLLSRAKIDAPGLSWWALCEKVAVSND